MGLTARTCICADAADRRLFMLALGATVLEAGWARGLRVAERMV